MKGHKTPYHQAVRELANYSTALVRLQNEHDNGIRSVNRQSDVQIDMTLLHRALQPYPVTPRRKINLIVNHMIHQGMYATRVPTAVRN